MRTALESLDRRANSGELTGFDALLGTAPPAPSRALRYNRPPDQYVGKAVYAVDVGGPSGRRGCAGPVKATRTTLAAMKKGLLTRQAQPYVGELHVGDIGVPVAPLLDS